MKKHTIFEWVFPGPKPYHCWLYPHLVGGDLTMLKNISEWKGWHPIYYGKTKKNVPNHQPVIWCLMISPWKKLHWNWPQHGLHFMGGLAVECSRLHRPRRKPCPALAAAMDPWDRFNPQNHWFQSGVGKCSNWTSPKYWGYSHQQILESDVQNSQNRTFTNPCQY